MAGAIERFELNGSYSDWTHKELEGAEVGTQFFNKQFITRTLLEQRRYGRLAGRFGTWTMLRDYNAVGVERLSPQVDQRAAALFALEEVDFERVKFQFGGRYEHNGYSPEGARSRSFDGFSGAAGVNFGLWHGGALALNYTRSYRAPALEELYNFGPHTGNLTFEVGNDALSRELGNGVDLSLRHQASRARAELNLFFYRLSDFVYLAPTGEVDDGLLRAEYRQANARYMGAEAHTDVRLVGDSWVHLGFDLVDAQLRDSRTPLPRIPPARGRVAVDLRKGGFSLRPELVLSNAQWQLFPTETRTAGYAAVNLGASYNYATRRALHLLSFQVFNAGDKLYRNHLSFIKDRAPEIGRGVRFSYTVRVF
jgi:iron complex outermembrane receptor protein